jgi:acylphosphatase
MVTRIAPSAHSRSRRGDWQPPETARRPADPAGTLFDMETAHRRIIYHGRVQGVGFRMTTNRLATGFEVSGYVKNLGDGTVEVVASGRADEVGRFLEAIDREFGPNIRDRAVSEFAPGSSEPFGFEIRY